MLLSLILHFYDHIKLIRLFTFIKHVRGGVRLGLDSYLLVIHITTQLSPCNVPCVWNEILPFENVEI